MSGGAPSEAGVVAIGGVSVDHAFDALRRLPADRRGGIPSEEGVLVLCPFDPDYSRDRWSKLKLAFERKLKAWLVSDIDPHAILKRGF